MTLKKGDKPVKVTRPESAKASEVTAPLLSAMQVAKAVRKKQDCFLIRVMPKDADIGYKYSSQLLWNYPHPS